MRIKNTTSAPLGIYNKFERLLQIDNSVAECTCFIIKIANHDLLSALLSEEQLHGLLQEVEQIVISTMRQTPHPIHNDRLINYDRYIVFTVTKANLLAVNQLAYLIYHNIQLHISEICPYLNLKCKISSINLDKDSKNPQELLRNLFGLLSCVGSDNYYVEYDEAVVEAINADAAKLHLFKKSLSENTFSFAYQPIVDRVTGYIPYYECLLRIPNENLELVSAGQYIEIAERAGLNNVLDQVVLHMAANELKAAPHISLAVNISNSGIVDFNLLQTARLLLSDKSVAKRLVIEITETSLNVDFEKTKIFADIMRGFGCKIALDDFGSGFTSFKQLQNLSIDIIKIDGSFIRDVVYNQRDQHLVVSLIDIAKKLRAKTVAEFVENGEIAKFLLDVGVDYMQGNFFSPALNYRTWNKE